MEDICKLKDNTTANVKKISLDEAVKVNNYLDSQITDVFKIDCLEHIEFKESNFNGVTYSLNNQKLVFYYKDCRFLIKLLSSRLLIDFIFVDKVSDFVVNVGEDIIINTPYQKKPIILNSRVKKNIKEVSMKEILNKMFRG